MNFEPARMASYQSDLSMIAVESGSTVDWQEDAASTKDDSNWKLISFAGAIFLICGVFALFADLHASMSNRAVMVTAPKCSAPESKETLRLFLKAFYGMSMSQDSVRQAYMEEMMKHVSGDVVIDNDLDERVGQDDDAAEWERRSNHYEGRDSVPRWALKFDSFGRKLAKARGERTFGVLANGNLIHIVRFDDDDDTKASVIASRTERNEEGRCVMTGVKFARGLNTREIPQPVADGTVALSNDTLEEIVQNGLGKAFYLPKTDIMAANEGGTRFFTDKILEDVSCVRSTPYSKDSGRASYQMSIFKSMESFVTSVTTNAEVSGSFATAAFTATTTVTSTTQSSSRTKDTFYSSKMDVSNYVRYIEFQKTTACMINEDSINPRVLLDFQSLPLITSTDTPYKERWDPYEKFLTKLAGSHIMTEMNLGSRLIVIESTTTKTKDVEKMLAIKACVAVEGVTPSASKYKANSCAAYNSTQRKESTSFSSQSSHSVLGGSKQTRLALINKITPENLHDFIMSADDGTTPVRMKYTAVWDLMMMIYQSKCLNSKDVNDVACQSMQRAKNLQAYYEGFSAFECPRLTSGSIVIQQMKQQKPPNSKWSTYYCWAQKDGCTSNDDCHGVTSCFCYGDGCVDSYEDSMDVMRPKIRHKEKGDTYDGVNNACHFSWGCACRKKYKGGEPERHLWDLIGNQ